MGIDATSGPPAVSLSYTDLIAELENQVTQVIASGHIQPRPHYWGWTTDNLYSFWREGEVIASLARTLPYLNPALRSNLKSYLQNEASTYLFDEAYSYRERCLVYGIQYLIDPCTSSAYPGQIRMRWFADDLNVVAENLYAMWAYAHYTEDWTLIANNWAKINNLFNRLRNSFDDDLDIIIERESNGSPKRWHTPDFKINTQIAAMFGVSQMAAHQGATTVQSQAESMLNKILAKRTWTGQYAKTLYYETFHRAEAEDLIWNYDVFPYQGYRDHDTDVRQVQWLDDQLVEIFGYPHTPGTSGIHSDSSPGVIGNYEDLINYRPLYPELGQFLADNLYAETQMYVDSVKNLNPWWYWSDAAIAAQGGSENLYNHAHLSAAMFQTQAYVLGETYQNLVPQLPWTFADSNFRDIYRLQNLIALLDVYEPSAAEQSDKKVTPPTADQGDTLTYVITLVGNGQPMTLTDPIPAGVSYVVGSAQLDPSLGDLTDTESQILWTGTIPENTTMQITIPVLIKVSIRTAIENVAQLQLAGSTNVFNLRAVAIANSYKCYFPLIIKDH